MNVRGVLDNMLKIYPFVISLLFYVQALYACDPLNENKDEEDGAITILAIIPERPFKFDKKSFSERSSKSINTPESSKY